MPASLTAHLVVPVANEEDARETVRVLDGYEYDRVHHRLPCLRPVPRATGVTTDEDPPFEPVRVAGRRKRWLRRSAFREMLVSASSVG